MTQKLPLNKKARRRQILELVTFNFVYSRVKVKFAFQKARTKNAPTSFIKIMMKVKAEQMAREEKEQKMTKGCTRRWIVAKIICKDCEYAVEEL